MIDPIVLGCLAASVVLVVGLIWQADTIAYERRKSDFWLHLKERWNKMANEAIDECNDLRYRLGNRKRDDKGRFVKGDK